MLWWVFQKVPMVLLLWWVLDLGWLLRCELHFGVAVMVAVVGIASGVVVEV